MSIRALAPIVTNTPIGAPSPSLTNLAGLAELTELRAHSADVAREGSPTELMSPTTRAKILGRLSLAVPAVGLAAGIALLTRGKRDQRSLGFVLAGGSVVLGLLRSQFGRVFDENPSAREERLIPSAEQSWASKAAPNDVAGTRIEFRTYAPHIVAETVVRHARWSQAIDEGFDRLFKFIDRGNIGEHKIEMVSPVFGSLSEGITENDPPLAARGSVPPTSSVVIRPVGEADHIVSFVMPASRLLETLPRPLDARIRFREVSARRVAVLRFSGRYGSDLPLKKREELLRAVHAAGLTPIGDVSCACYDPPWTLPILRRNEVMVEVMG